MSASIPTPATAQWSTGKMRIAAGNGIRESSGRTG